MLTCKRKIEHAAGVAQSQRLRQADSSGRTASALRT